MKSSALKDRNLAFPQRPSTLVSNPSFGSAGLLEFLCFCRCFICVFIFSSVVPPIYMSSSYQRQDVASESSYYDNPTRTVLEQTLAALDNGKYSLSFPSGTGGQTALIATLKAGDGIICGDNIYTGTIGLFREIAADLGIVIDFIDLVVLDNLRKALKPNTKIVWMETPTNPMMIVQDIRAIAEITHQQSGAILVVDNTPLSSYFQRPLDLGADAVAYSLTKFMNGHNDVGCFCVRATL